LKPYFVLFFLIILVACSVSKIEDGRQPKIPKGTYEDTLRFLYSLPSSQWPAATADVDFRELAVLPPSPLQLSLDSLKHIILLGKTLFFDERLSSSNRISCASCHKPELSWTDGRPRSVGHDGAMNKRNSPSVQNVWFYHQLFWDGRSHSLEDQAFAPINSESEMSSDMPATTGKLRRIKGYEALFDSAFGDHHITPENITEALAVFQRTVISNKSSFDNFLLGDHNALSGEELRGLDLFRTKARCINCHNGPLLSDNDFHNTGLANFGKPNEDLGRFWKTKNEADKGKFKTPSLRDAVSTGPWMHNGSFVSLEEIIQHYNNIIIDGTADKLLQPLHLSAKEQNDIIAFLRAISSEPVKIDLPQMP
jgi:cytochrome c peroxidase